MDEAIDGDTWIVPEVLAGMKPRMKPNQCGKNLQRFAKAVKIK
jgi:hypothetical protein